MSEERGEFLWEREAFLWDLFECGVISGGCIACRLCSGGFRAMFSALVAVVEGRARILVWLDVWLIHITKDVQHSFETFCITTVCTGIQSEVSAVGPTGSPAILDDPIGRTCFKIISNNFDGMICIELSTVAFTGILVYIFFIKETVVFLEIFINFK